MGIVVVPPGPIWVGLRGYAWCLGVHAVSDPCLLIWVLPAFSSTCFSSCFFSSNCFFSSTCFTLPLLHSTTSTLPLPYHFYPNFYRFFPHCATSTSLALLPLRAIHCSGRSAATESGSAHRFYPPVCFPRSCESFGGGRISTCVIRGCPATTGIVTQIPVAHAGPHNGPLR